MTAQSERHKRRIAFSYHTLRNISAPEDSDERRKVYAGNAPATSFISLPEDENVREYIVTAEGKKGSASLMCIDASGLPSKILRKTSSFSTAAS